MRLTFDWDPAKDASNARKHGVAFRRAATVFRDPCQLSIYDEEHSVGEDRWVTIGVDSGGILQVVVHTYREIDETAAEVRIISARRATGREIRQYEERAR